MTQPKPQLVALAVRIEAALKAKGLKPQTVEQANLLNDAFSVLFQQWLEELL